VHSANRFKRDPSATLQERTGDESKQSPMLALHTPDPALGLPASSTNGYVGCGTVFELSPDPNGGVAADPETLRQLAGFSEREIASGTGLHRKPIRLFRHGGTVTRRTYQKIMNFLKQHSEPSAA